MTKAGSKSRTLMGSTASESRIESGSTSPESRTTDDEDGSRETPPYRAPMGARKYTGLTTMTKEWEREFAVSRMQEDPTISYRALAKVLGTSDATIRQWRDEEGIHPRPHHNTGRRRDGTRSVPWPGKPARPIEPELQDDEERQDGEEPEEEDNDEAFELDDTPAGSHAANLAQTWETIGRLGGLRLGSKAATPRRARSSAPTGATPSPRRPTPTDPWTQLQAITAALDAGKPRGPAAVKLLVEAASYLTGGVTALRQYGEARGCAPSDIVAAERSVVGKGKL